MKIVDKTRQSWKYASKIEKMLFVGAIGLASLTLTLCNLEYDKGGRYAPAMMVAALLTSAASYFVSNYNRTVLHERERL